MAKTHTARFNMVMLPMERAMLQRLADHEGLRESDIIRQEIRKAYKEIFGNKRPGKPEPKYNSAAVIGRSK